MSEIKEEDKAYVYTNRSECIKLLSHDTSERLETIISIAYHLS